MYNLERKLMVLDQQYGDYPEAKIVLDEIKDTLTKCHAGVLCKEHGFIAWDGIDPCDIPF